MTGAATDTQQLRELEEDVRRAWNEYSEQLRELNSEAYEQAEHECWAELQEELKMLESRRRQLIGG